MSVSVADLRQAQARIGGEIVADSVRIFADVVAADRRAVYLKFENQQFTASFKERGALNRLLELTADERRRGVIAMSAGNHAQAVAYHGKRLGIPTCIVMPRTTPNAKVEQTRVFDAEVILVGSGFDDARTFALTEAARRNLTLVHPFDDPAVIAGQGTLGARNAGTRPGARGVDRADRRRRPDLRHGGRGEGAEAGN